MRSVCSFLRTAGGLRFAYMEQGERIGPAVLMLHGYSDSHHSFDLIRPHLPQNMRVIALTMRGHGQSDKPFDVYDVAEFAADVPEVLDALGIESAILVGHSLGAAVALDAAAAYPARVSGIALIGGFADFRNNAGVIELVDAVKNFTDPVDPEFVLAFQESTIADMIPQRFLDLVVSESLRLPAHVWRSIGRGLVAADPLRAAVRASAPALLMRGVKDAFVPEADQQLLAGALGDARWVEMYGAGHAPHWEAPAETAAILTDFVRELSGARTRELEAAA